MADEVSGVPNFKIDSIDSEFAVCSAKVIFIYPVDMFLLHGLPHFFYKTIHL